MTLLEMTVVIFALLLLAGLLLTSARAWKRGSDRASCILNIQAVQKSVRGFANMRGVSPGATVTDLEAEVVGSGSFFESLPMCPADGNYTLKGNTIPEIGILYMTCSLSATDEHEPKSFTSW